MWRQTFLPSFHQTFLRYFDAAQEQWVVPWEKLTQKWVGWLSHRDDFTDPVQVDYPDLEPSLNILKAYQTMISQGNISNKLLAEKMGATVDEAQDARILLNKLAFVSRIIFLYHLNLFEWLSVEIDGQEEWKRQVLVKIGEVLPFHFLYLLEDVTTGKTVLGGLYSHPPPLGLEVMQHFSAVFGESLDGIYHFRKLVARPIIAPQDLTIFFDSQRNTWTWNPEDYYIQPIPQKSK